MENFYKHLIDKTSRGKFLTPMARKAMSTLVLVFGLFFGIQGVLAHGVQIGYCVLDNGNLRVYIEHWHGSEYSGPLSVTTTYANGSSTTQTIYASGYAWSTSVANLPGCGADINIIEACPNEANTYNDWLYWDFPPGACDGSEIITVEAGTTVVTTESCSELYPQTINPTELTCPNIEVNSCFGTTVDYAVQVTDFCDPNVMLDYSVPSGSYFNTGTTEVMVTATNSFGYTTSCKFDVFVGELDADADGDGFTGPDACTGSQDDCDDNDPNVYPGAPEICDGKDNNCDGEMETATVYNIPIDDFYNMYYMCDYYSGLSWYTYNNFGFSWMSIGNNIPSSVSVEFVITYDDHNYYEYYYPMYYTPDRTVSLNYNYQNSFVSNYNYNCEEEDMYYQKNHVQMVLDPNDYNPGGYNYIDIGNVFTYIGIYSDPALFPAGIFARVCVEYCNTADEAPIVDAGTCPMDITLCGAQTVSWTPPTATDNCDIPTVSSNYNPGEYFDVGVHNVVYTFTDEAGLTTTCEFKITINPLPQVTITQSDLPEWCQGVKVLNAKVANIADLAEPLSYQWSTGETASSIIATANGPYSVVVTDANGCTSSGMTIVDEDLTQLLSAHTIVVDDEMDMDNSVVLTGGVGVLDADEVTIQDNSDITTFLVSAQAFIDASSNVADYDNSDSPLSFPAFISNSNIDTNDETINGTVTLSGSNYGHVVVKAGATLNIGNGEMYMRSLTVGKGGTVNFNQEGVLMIRQKMSIGEMCSINVEGPGVVVYVQDNVSVGQGSTVAVDIFAPEGMDVNDSGSFLTTYMYGLFVTDELNSGDNVEWGWNLTCGDLGVDNGNGGGGYQGAYCGEATGTPGFSDDPTCEAAICAADPFCCDTSWDSVCASAAAALADGACSDCMSVDLCGDGVQNGDEIGVDCGGSSCPICPAGTGDCFTSNGTPGCNDAVCQDIICSADPFCCDISWDGICASAAQNLCGAPFQENINTSEVATNDVDKVTDLTVFPNPTSGILNISVYDFIGSEVDVVITNTIGQRVWNQHIDVLEVARVSVDLSGDRYASGLYNLTLFVDGEAITKQIVLTK